MTLAGLLDTASLLVVAAGVGAGALVLVRTRALLPALASLLELLTAAGLLRLAATPTYDRAAAAAGVLVVRRLATLGLRGDLPGAGVAGRLRRSLVPALARSR